MGMPDRVRVLAQFEATRRDHPWRVTLAGALVVGGIVLLLAPQWGGTIGPIAVAFASVFTGTTGLRRSRQIDVRRARLAWSFISIGYLSAALGLLTTLALLPFIQLGAFGPADIFIVLGYSLWAAGIILIPSAVQERSERIRVVLDALVGVISLVAISWVLFLNELFENLQGAPIWDRIMGTAYPLFDLLVLIVLMIMFLRRSAHRFDLRLGLMSFGAVFQIAGDLTFVVSGAGRSFTEVEPIFGLWVTAFGFYLLSATMIPYRPAPREYSDRVRPPLWPLLAPYAMAAAMVVVLVTTVTSTMTNTGAAGETFYLLVATIIVGVLVILRQLAAIRENREHVERERRALISTISHELRTPLTAMVGFLDLVNNDEVQLEEAERDEMIDVVDKQARYLSRIVSDLVLLARGRADQMELDRAETNIAEVIARSITSLDTGLNDARVLVAPDLVADVDDNRILQALVNLLSNAIRYGGDDRAVVATASNGDLIIEVHDSGPGVPVRHQLAIWERFERGANRLNAVVPGSGIGLAIVRAIAEAHGGSVGYRTSELLEGACFFVTVPDCVVDVSHRDSAWLGMHHPAIEGRGPEPPALERVTQDSSQVSESGP
jgi:signal transduction histidine kinase